MRIESYEFGEVVIDGVTYRSDVILLPDSVKSGWWRREGHRLDLRDLDEIIAAGPEVVVVGTGFHGRMDVPDDLVREIVGMGIEIIAIDTKAAVESFNEISNDRKTAAALHLTC